MSGYGPPPSAPATGTGASGLGLGAILGYAAGGLAVLDFIWGFLDFFSPSQGDGDGVSGYSSIGAGIIGLAIVAGLLAAAETFEKKPTSLLPVVFSVAGLLLVFGTLVSDPAVGSSDSVDKGIGLILALITSILQVAVLVYAYLLATGKISAPAPKSQAPQGYGPPQGGQPGYGGPGGYGQPGPPQGGGQPGYGAPQGPPSGPPQGPPPGAPQGPPPGQQQGGGFGPPSSYGAPSSYGPPQGGPGGPGSQPGQSAPGQSSPPPPTGNPYSPPQGS